MTAMMSFRAVHAGDGYTYLLRSVATNDAYDASTETGKLAGYYQAKGTPPGRWRGRGLVGFNSDTVVDGAVVEADHMAALYGLGMHPQTDEMLELGVSFDDCKLGGKFPVYTNDVPVLNALRAAENAIVREEKRLVTDAERSELAVKIGRKYYVEATGYTHASGEDIVAWVNEQKQQVRQAVAGYDLTFSPAKSVSVLWALADEDTASKIAACHHRAVAEALDFVDTEVARTRRGAKGIAQVTTRGIIATEFTHFDTRAGDPDLHSHVLVSNKVQAEDGTWLALDGQPLFMHHQAISARYDAALHRILDEEMGLSMVERARENTKEGVWEIDGVPEELIEAFSKRRALARPIYQQYLAAYAEKYGRQPDKLTQKNMWQQAILDTRDAKKPAESLAALRDNWVGEVLDTADGDKLLQQVRALVDKPMQDQRKFFLTDNDELIDETADKILRRVTDKRSFFGRHHLDTAASTVLKGYRFHTADELNTVRDRIITAALDKAVALTPAEPLNLPKHLIRADGKAVDRRLGSEKYTTRSILAAEDNAVQAITEPVAVFASNALVDKALQQHSDAKGWSLNTGQAELARHLLNAGTLAATGVGPAGTGKTTSMQIVTTVWQRMGRNVIGLAPSAAAAEVLGEEISIDATTIDQLTFTWSGRNPWRRGHTLSELPVQISAGDMLLVDEAGMATTENISMLCDIAREAGAIVRFVGDPHQLDAVGNGGLFGAMCNAAPTAELTDVMRFSKGKDTEQADASLTLRLGRTSAIDFYDKRGWLEGGSRAQMLTAAVDAYLADVNRGRRSLIIAATNTDVDAINEMIRADRIEQGIVDDSVEVPLAHGDVAGVGDIIIARTNQKFWTTDDNGRERCTGRVINGQMFVVTAIGDDGSLQVRDLNKGHNMELDSTYVSHSCHLGYAATIHRSQGATVDTTHAVVDASTSRAGLYVALTRGAKENHIWAVTEAPVDETAEDMHDHLAGNPGPLEARDVVELALSRDNRQRTARETRATEWAEAHSLQRRRDLYAYAVDGAIDAFIDATFAAYRRPWWSDEGAGKVQQAWKAMLENGVDPRPHMGWATWDMTGARDDGAVVAWRLRTKLPATSSSVVQPPPMLASSDRELDVWLREAYAELTAPLQAPAGDAPPRLSAKALQGRSLIDSVLGDAAPAAPPPRGRGVETGDAASQEQESAVRSSKAAQGMSLIDLVATPDDLNSVHKTGKTADQGIEQENQHPAEQLDADHTRDNKPTL